MRSAAGRLQVELYKEIKKNGSSRCVRAALCRFAELAYLILPQKCRCDISMFNCTLSSVASIFILVVGVSCINCVVND